MERLRDDELIKILSLPRWLIDEELPWDGTMFWFHRLGLSSYLFQFELVDYEAEGGIKVAIRSKKDGMLYILFPGTYDNEWNEGVRSVCKADCAFQRDAQRFVNKFEEDLVVVGYGIGGNKAEYVSVLCPQVTRCVTLNALGFSKRFVEKYLDLIEKSKSKRTSYVGNQELLGNLFLRIQPNVVNVRGKRDIEQKVYRYLNPDLCGGEETQQQGVMRSISYTLLENVKEDENQNQIEAFGDILQDIMGGFA